MWNYLIREVTEEKQIEVEDIFECLLSNYLCNNSI